MSLDKEASELLEIFASQSKELFGRCTLSLNNLKIFSTIEFN